MIKIDSATKARSIGLSIFFFIRMLIVHICAICSKVKAISGGNMLNMVRVTETFCFLLIISLTLGHQKHRSNENIVKRESVLIKISLPSRFRFLFTASINH